MRFVVSPDGEHDLVSLVVGLVCGPVEQYGVWWMQIFFAIIHRRCWYAFVDLFWFWVDPK